MAAPLRLEMEGVCKSFGGVPVLRHVGLRLRAGEVLALLGANGAGKSTLVKILCGAHHRDQGTIRLDGVPVSFATPQEAMACGVRLLPQEISILPDLSVAENIFIGDLPARGALDRIDWQQMRQQARQLLARLGLALDPEQPMQHLAPPQQRLVEIARALAGRARIIIMDEPTAALTEQETALLFEIIHRLKEEQVGIVYISHYLDEVFRIANCIEVLRDGRNQGTFPTAATSRQQVLEAMLGSSPEDLYPPGAGRAGEVVLRVEELTLPGVLDKVGFEIGRGEIVGIFGLLGSGVAQVGRALYGALGPVLRARVELEGRPFSPEGPRRARDAGIGFVAAERQREGIIPDLSLRANITLPFIDRFQSGLAVSVARETAHVAGWIDRLGIRARGCEQLIRFLSGGNQQKACLARWLVEGVKVLILEEPTRGVDVGARRELYAALRHLTGRGLAVLVASSDVEEVAGLCDRVLVLDRGRVAGRFERGTPPARLLEAASWEREVL
jgi:ribose transport system ATP-binding protein